MPSSRLFVGIPMGKGLEIIMWRLKATHYWGNHTCEGGYLWCRVGASEAIFTTLEIVTMKNNFKPKFVNKKTPF